LLGESTTIEIEVEAITSTSGGRRDSNTANEREKIRGYVRAVAVGNVVQVPGYWVVQFDLCYEGVTQPLELVGASLDDVVRRRSFTIAAAEQNRPYGDGPGWLKDSRPVSMGCRMDSLADPVILVEVDDSGRSRCRRGHRCACGYRMAGDKVGNSAPDEPYL
jgi:hypothetical protein